MLEIKPHLTNLFSADEVQSGRMPADGSHPEHGAEAEEGDGLDQREPG